MLFLEGTDVSIFARIIEGGWRTTNNDDVAVAPNNDNDNGNGNTDGDGDGDDAGSTNCAWSGSGC